MPSSEISSSYVVLPMENSYANAVETAGSCDQGEEEGHVITLYQLGRAVTGRINSRISNVDPELDAQHSAVLPQEERIERSPHGTSF